MTKRKKIPKTAPVLRENFYMDDILRSAPTLEEAEELQRQLIEIMQKADISLHKWCTNHKNLSLNLGKEYTFENEIKIKTFGVLRVPKEDCLTFTIKVELSDSYTKRQVLLTIARIFLLGLLGLVIAKA